MHVTEGSNCGSSLSDFVGTEGLTATMEGLTSLPESMSVATMADLASLPESKVWLRPFQIGPWATPFTCTIAEAVHPRRSLVVLLVSRGHWQGNGTYPRLCLLLAPFNGPGVRKSRVAGRLIRRLTRAASSHRVAAGHIDARTYFFSTVGFWSLHEDIHDLACFLRLSMALGFADSCRW